MSRERTRSVLDSAVAGVAATGVMTAAMFLLDHVLPGRREDSLPPRNVAVGMSRKIGLAHRMDQPERTALTWISHFGYGTGVATVYPYTARHIPVPPVWRGILYGFAVWVASYAGWLPKLGILPPPQGRALRQNVLLILAHGVWGGDLSSVTERLTHAPLGLEPAASHRRAEMAGSI